MSSDSFNMHIDAEDLKPNYSYNFSDGSFCSMLRSPSPTPPHSPLSPPWYQGLSISETHSNESQNRSPPLYTLPTLEPPQPNTTPFLSDSHHPSSPTCQAPKSPSPWFAVEEVYETLEPRLSPAAPSSPSYPAQSPFTYQSSSSVGLPVQSIKSPGAKSEDISGLVECPEFSSSPCPNTSNDDREEVDMEASEPSMQNPVEVVDDSPQEVVDVEQSQPCIVDLTEDDDDIEIVSTEQSVVFLGTEPNVRRIRRRMKPVPTVPVCNEAIVISDDPPVTVPSQSTGSQSLPLHAPPPYTPELFGDLLNPSFLPVADDRSGFDLQNYQSQTQVSNTIERGPETLPTTQPSNQPTIESIMDAPIPQEVLDDLASIFAVHDSFSSYEQGYLRTPNHNRYNTRLSTSTMAAGGGVPFSQAVAASNAGHAGSQIKIEKEDPTEWSCPICFESKKEAKKSGKSFASTICGHVFCTSCLEASLKQAKRVCPICRKKLNKKQYHTVFI